MAIEIDMDYAVFDAETGPLDDDTLRGLCPEFVPPAHPGKFDPAAVKLGNLKDAVKKAEKIEEYERKHFDACRDYNKNVEVAKLDHFEKFKDSAALNSLTGQVVAIGVISSGEARIYGCDHDSEAYGLGMFWRVVAECLKVSRPMIGFNIHGFDLPFLVNRSRILGVTVPSCVRVGRYWNPLFIDLMREWFFGGPGYISLDVLAKAFGLPGKMTTTDDGIEVSGKDFYKLWQSNRAAAEKYLVRDLELPAVLAQRMGVV